MIYRISIQAKTDLINIWEYTFENWSIEQADKYFKLLTDKIKELSRNPEIGKKYKYARKDYWGISIKSHIIFYKFYGNEIEVIRILHQKMNITKRLKE